MSVDVEPPPPRAAALSVRGLVAVGWSTGGRAARRLSLADVGTVRLRDLPVATRALVRVGFVLLGLMLLLVLTADRLRGAGPLVAGTGGTLGRGSLLPEAALPATLFAIAVAWTYLLTGALRAHLALRLGVLAAYVGTTSSWIAGGLPSTTERALSWSLLAAVPLFSAWRWRAPRRPALEPAVLLALVGAEHVLVQRLLVDAWRISGVATFLPTVQTTVLLVGTFVTPLLILVGIDVADVVVRAAGAVGGSVRRLPRVVGTALVGLAVGAAGVQAVATLARGQGGGPLAFLGALGIPVVCVGVVLGVRRLSRDRAPDTASGAAPEPGPEPGPEPFPDGHAAEPAPPAPGADVLAVATRNAARLALAFSGWEVLLTVVVLAALTTLAAGGVAATGFVTTLVGLVDRLTGSGQELWLRLFAVAAAVLAVLLARAGRRTTATYLGLVGGTALWNALTAEDGPLAALTWPGRPTVTAWWTLGLVVLVVRLALRGRLDVARGEVALLLAVVLLLAGRAEAVADPFSVVLASAGLGLLVVGVVWDALTVGGWANEDSRAFPHADRMLLYLGYVLFSLAVVAWAVATHDVERLEYFTEGAADVGLAFFGVPVLYAVYVLGGERLLRDVPSPDGERSATVP